MAGSAKGFFVPVLLQRSFPLGCVLLWEGSKASIPTHFGLCDGTNGTPDMLDRFVVASHADTVGDTGGSTTHDHDFTGNGHTHEFVETAGLDESGKFWTKDTNQSQVQGTTDPVPTLPIYYSTCYIMRID